MQATKEGLFQRKESAGVDRGLVLFGAVLLTQLGHLLEHISVAISGHGVVGDLANSEPAHFAFNALILVFSFVLLLRYPRNGALVALVVIASLHLMEHAYIFAAYLANGVTNGPGLFDARGLVPLAPLSRLELHNFYNGTELVLLALGFWNQVESTE